MFVTELMGTFNCVTVLASVALGRLVTVGAGVSVGGAVGIAVEVATLGCVGGRLAVGMAVGIVVALGGRLVGVLVEDGCVVVVAEATKNGRSLAANRPR